MRRPIVIVGGMGPQASVRLHQLTLQHSRRYHSGAGHEYPYIVHFSVPVQDFISDSTHKNAALAQLCALAPLVAALNPSCIALACNTAHLLANEVPYLHGKSFVSLLETVVKQLEHDEVCTVGLLASPTTIRTRLYEKYLHAAGIAAIRPNDQQLTAIENTIRSVITMQPARIPAQQLAPIASSLASRGAEAILLGCTELPLVYQQGSVAIPVYDCLDLYAQAITRHYYLYNGV